MVNSGDPNFQDARQHWNSHDANGQSRVGAGVPNFRRIVDFNDQSYAGGTSMEKQSLDEFYGICPQQSTYRPANLLSICSPSATSSDPQLVEILSLTERDKIFCHRLLNDKQFHDIFWNWNHRGSKWNPWNPSSEAEKNATNIIEEAIQDRVQLVVLQKLYVGTMSSHPISDSTKELQRQANMELGYVFQWLNESKPGHRYLRRKIIQASVLDYTTTNVIKD